jgi:hypothetical protein
MKNTYLLTSLVLAFVLTMTGNAQKSTTSDIRYHDPGLNKVVQVAIVVRDIEASSKLWADLLGMPVPEISTTRPGMKLRKSIAGNHQKDR